MNKMLLACVVILSGISFCWATEGYNDLAKLVKSKVSDDVILAFINSSNVNYSLTPDEIINLKDLGASSAVITAAIQHKKPVEAASTPRQAVVLSDNPDNPVVYESAPPPEDYSYDGYWQYPPDDFIYSYPGWQPYYGYYQRRGYDHGYSHDHGYSNGHGHGNGGGQRAQTTGASKSTTQHKTSK